MQSLRREYVFRFWNLITVKPPLEVLIDSGVYPRDVVWFAVNLLLDFLLRFRVFDFDKLRTHFLIAAAHLRIWIVMGFFPFPSEWYAPFAFGQ